MLEKRILKIYNNGNGWKKKPTACITLQGDWISTLGFELGKKVLVEVKKEDSENIITIKLIKE